MARSRAIGMALTTTALAGLLQLATTLGAPPALACSCAAMTNAEYVDNADVIFAGTLLSRKEPPSGRITSSGDLVTLTFAVSEVYKGQVGAMAQVRTARSGASCGLEITGDGPFLAFTTFDGDGLTASLCNGTRRLPDTVPAVLGDGRPPAGSGVRENPEEMASDRTDGTRIDPDDEPSWLWIAGAAASIGLAGWLGLWLRRRTSD